MMQLKEKWHVVFYLEIESEESEDGEYSYYDSGKIVALSKDPEIIKDLARKLNQNDNIMTLDEIMDNYEYYADSWYYVIDERELSSEEVAKYEAEGKIFSTSNSL